jgi:hypothetical protein
LSARSQSGFLSESGLSLRGQSGHYRCPQPH